jgi:hypothetical protein
MADARITLPPGTAWEREKTYYRSQFESPEQFVELMKSDGFQFNSEACPIQLTEPFECEHGGLMHDTVTYRQGVKKQ